MTGEAGFDFSFAKTHYNIYPWIETPGALVRVMRIDQQPIVAFISPRPRSTRGGLRLRLHSPSALAMPEVNMVSARLRWALGLDERSSGALLRLSEEDPVIAAALLVNKGITPKSTLVSLRPSAVRSAHRMSISAACTR